MSGDTYAVATSTASPVAVINPTFCVDHPVDLTITRKMMTFKDGSFQVTDVNGNVMFSVRGDVFSFHDRRVLLDAAGNPLLTFQQKTWSAHRRWQAFRGESREEKDEIFSVKKSSYFMLKTQLDVFFTSNTTEQIPDYRIEGSWFERSCVIYAGNTNNIIAQMHRKQGAMDYLIGKDIFGVTVSPNVDYAFVVALVVILQEINEDRDAS